MYTGVLMYRIWYSPGVFNSERSLETSELLNGNGPDQFLPNLSRYKNAPKLLNQDYTGLRSGPARPSPDSVLCGAMLPENPGTAPNA